MKANRNRLNFKPGEATFAFGKCTLGTPAQGVLK
jgi:hypothetical protein